MMPFVNGSEVVKQLINNYLPNVVPLLQLISNPYELTSVEFWQAFTSANVADMVPLSPLLMFILQRFESVTVYCSIVLIWAVILVHTLFLFVVTSHMCMRNILECVCVHHFNLSQREREII